MIQKINIGDVLYANIYNQYVSVEIIDIKKTIFGNLKYLCKYDSSVHDGDAYWYNKKMLKWISGKDLFN